jgi:hypothetical protein
VLTVVMLNWARPQYALMNIHRYASYGIVKHVFCFNSGASLRHSGPLPMKCVLIESSTDLGLNSRLAAASLATTDAIFHYHWLVAKSSCHGLHGRIAYPTYEYGDIFGPVEVLLTRAVICSRRVNNTALSVTDLFSDMTAIPRGNGEDIILSFAAMATAKQLNFAYCLPSENLPDCDDVAIHKRWSNHLNHRKQVVSRCRMLFFGQGPGTK